MFQTAYIDSLLKKHGLENANPVSTPLDPNIKLDLDPNEENNSEMQRELSKCPSIGYVTLISSLIYLAIGMWLDIAYSVQHLAQFTQDPKPVHWTAVKQIFWYLKGTRTLGLNYWDQSSLGMSEQGGVLELFWACSYVLEHSIWI